MLHSEFFTGVEALWTLWLTGGVLLAVLASRALRGFRWRECRAFLLAEEDGAAYSLAYVMTFPIYVLLVCGVIEITLLLVVKIGTVYAAYAGARSAIVWSSAEPRLPQQKAELAVVHALTPFASSSPVHAQRAGVGNQTPAGAKEYVQAFQKYARKQGDSSFLAMFKPDASWSAGGGSLEQYLLAKYRFAQRATKVRLEPQQPAWNGDLTATVTYDYPLNIPIVGRVLRDPAGSAALGQPAYRLTSKVTLPNEGPKDGPTVGIKYVSE